MDKLMAIVKELEQTYDEKEQIQILQEINSLLLTDYEVRIGDEIIHPLRIEAYYWPYQSKGKFDDSTTFPSDDKLWKFGKLYFIESQHGYPGIDICLSNGDYYLSFLIKNSYIENKLYKQIALYEKFINLKEKLNDEVVLFTAPHRNENVFHTVRVMNSVKDLDTKPFAKKCLASLIDINRKDENGKSIFDWANNFGKEWTVAEYMRCHPEKDRKTQCRTLIGYNSSTVLKILEEMESKK